MPDSFEKSFAHQDLSMEFVPLWVCSRLGAAACRERPHAAASQSASASPRHALLPPNPPQRFGFSELRLAQALYATRHGQPLPLKILKVEVELRLHTAGISMRGQWDAEGISGQCARGGLRSTALGFVFNALWMACH